MAAVHALTCILLMSPRSFIDGSRRCKLHLQPCESSHRIQGLLIMQGKNPELQARPVLAQKDPNWLKEHFTCQLYLSKLKICMPHKAVNSSLKMVDLNLLIVCLKDNTLLKRLLRMQVTKNFVICSKSQWPKGTCPAT